MTTTLLAANAAWTGLVIALWTKRLWETHYARLLIVQRSRISLRDCRDTESVYPAHPRGKRRPPKGGSGEPYDCDRQDRRPALVEIAERPKVQRE